MSHSYSPIAALLASITLPDDGDSEVAASVNVPFEALANAIKNLQDGTAKPVYIEFLTNSINWLLPSNALASVIVSACGGGGGGGGGAGGVVGTDSYTVSGSGGAGSIFRTTVLSLTPGLHYDWLVGAGGAPGSADTGTTATAGGFGGTSLVQENIGSVQIAGGQWAGAQGGLPGPHASYSTAYVLPGGFPVDNDLRKGSDNFPVLPNCRMATNPSCGGDGCNKLSFKFTSNKGYKGFSSPETFDGGSTGTEGTDASTYRGGGAGGSGGGGPFGTGGSGGNGGNGNSGAAGASGTAGGSASANTGAGGGGGGAGGSGTSASPFPAGGAGGTGGSGRILVVYFIKVT